VQLDGSGLALGTRRIATLSLTGRAVGAESDPDLNATLTLAGIDADGVSGDATVTAQGRQNALRLHATANAPNVRGAPARLDTDAVLNTRLKQITLQSLNAGWNTILVRLQAPARFDFAQQIAVDQLRLALNQATLQASGRFGPTLDLSASVHNFTADILQPLAPQFAVAGTLSADARLTGQPAAPSGTLRVNATGLHMKTGPGATIPPATIAATVTLNGGAARIDVRGDAGPKLHLAANGAVPLRQDGALALVLRGNLDISLLNPVLQANGRNARGKADLNIAVSGTPLSPVVTGRIGLAEGELQDYVQGLDLRKITATIDATGDRFSITHFVASAGPGSISISGSVGAQAPYPVDLHIGATNARPLASDLLTALFDADLTVQGAAVGDMNATGKILLHRMDINIPDALPPSVAQLNVRRPGQAPPPVQAAAAPQASVHLAIDVDAPSNIFVRGKGLYAELGGKLHIAGTSSAPLVEGGFDMRRGDFSLAGTTLIFTRGTVGFNGAGVSGKIDPTLDFQADSIQNGIVATLKITGYADAPKIALSSVPDLPQDEVLAQLLFGTSMKQLTPFQIAEIGAALAELSGVVGGEGPLGSLRKRLGLDRLSVGGGTGGGASVEAGRYVAKGVYVGTKQTAGGAGGTQVQVQIDLTRHLKLNSALGSGGGTAQGATPENDPGSSIGLSYQFEY
jgi:translocation and assembly module TamB